MSLFRFKEFSIQQDDAVHKVGTDSMLLGALLNANFPSTILDIGTGTGVLSLMCAQKFPQATIDAIEINPLAVELARINFNTSPYSDRLQVIQANILEFKLDVFYDLIVTNPPYYTEDVKARSEQRQLARNAAAMPFNPLLDKVTSILAPMGKFYCVLPFARKEEIEQLIQSSALHIAQRITLNGTPNKPVRLIYCLQREISSPIDETITIRDNHGHYTEAYIQLTADFHAFRPR